MRKLNDRHMSDAFKKAKLGSYYRPVPCTISGNRGERGGLERSSCFLNLGVLLGEDLKCRMRRVKFSLTLFNY